MLLHASHVCPSLHINKKNEDAWLQGMCPQLLLGYAELFSKAAIPIYTPIHRVWEFLSVDIFPIL